MLILPQPGQTGLQVNKNKGHIKQARAFAPATVSNVGSGFDVLGFAIEQPEDVVSVRFTGGSGIKIVNLSPFPLPEDPMLNTAGKGVYELLRHTGNENAGIEILIEKKIWPGSGIGSSAACTVAAVLAANALLGGPLTKEELFPFCLSGEAAASKSRHADNVAPALLGGFCLVESIDPLNVVSLPVPDFLYCSVVLPSIIIQTAEARRMLKPEIPLELAVKQWARLGTLVAGLYSRNANWIGKGMEDAIIEPQREKLIPGFYRVKLAAIEAGALNCTISGSGPSVFALSEGEKTALLAGNAMKKVFEEMEIGCELYVSKAGAEGARIIQDGP